MLIKLLKAFYRDMRDDVMKFNYLNALISNIPGNFGITLRASVIARYFEHSGENLKIQAGVRYCGVRKISVGDNVIIGTDNFIQASGGLRIGDNTMMGPGVKIWTINHKHGSTDKPISEQGYEYVPVTIGKDVWICANVFILPGVDIPDGCIIGAGAVVTKNKYPPYSIICGNPAKVVGDRSAKNAKEIEALTVCGNLT